MTTFADFNLDPAILSALEKMQFKEPSPIQVEAIPLIQQKRDLIALAQTGSGKTATCAIPVCDRVDVDRPHIQALIIVPTRELAMQYATETQKIGREKHVKAFAIYGGEKADLQLAKLKHGVQVLVATPGRLIDFIYSRDIDLTQVETLILDEADEMLNMGFYDDLEFIIQCLVHEHQTLLFSATMPDNIQKIAKQHMDNPLEVVLTKDQMSPKLIDHYFLFCRHEDRSVSLVKQLRELKPKQSIVFCHSRHECERVCRELRKEQRDVDFLHAGLSQQVRTSVTNKFRTGKVNLLVATDVASRGLDFSGVTHVFIYHLSDDPDLYVHRSGRTGRYDKAGCVVTLVTRRELSALKRVLKHIQQEPNWIGRPPSTLSQNSLPEKPKEHRRGFRRPPKHGKPKKNSS